MCLRLREAVHHLADALSLEAAWETWCLPRPQPVDPMLITSSDAWELDAHVPDDFEQPTFPSNRLIPISMRKREANLIGCLSPSKGNVWKLLSDTMNSTIQNYSLTNSEYYSWDKFAEELDTVDLSEVSWEPPKEFDSRFYYYSQETNVTEQWNSC